MKLLKNIAAAFKAADLVTWWRVVVVALLAWIALEIRWTREDSYRGLDYSQDKALESMANNLSELVDRLGRR